MRSTNSNAARWLVVLALCLQHPGTLHAASGPGEQCDEAARRAEQQWGLPDGLLHAIGIVESGRPDPAGGHATPWPWALDVAGQPVFPETRQQAEDMLSSLQQRGPPTADIGCFQISLLFHPDAFPDPSRGFDPDRNAQAAARLLTELHAQTGSWWQAIQSYHSANPDLGIPYANRVLQVWGADAVAPETEHVIAGVRVIEPHAAGTAPQVIRIAGPAPVPRVFAGPSQNLQAMKESSALETIH